MSDKAAMVRLNGEVTAAICEADDLTRRAMLAWQRVRKAEAAMRDSKPDSEVERSYARLGVVSADGNAKLLMSVDRYSQDVDPAPFEEYEGVVSEVEACGTSTSLKTEGGSLLSDVILLGPGSRFRGKRVRVLVVELDDT